MCGIAGIVTNHSSNNDLDMPSLVKSMIQTLHHRGPDHTGIYAKEDVGLGHARLSIIDLSPAGNQPMSMANGALTIVFNGEIYNFQEIRDDLLAHEYEFESRSDTEVILKGYHLWGPKIFSKLRGMFAIAIWDARKQELIIARDRVGKKPLFYAWHNGNFIFGSEIKAILAYPGFPREPDLEAIHHFLSLQYVPAPWSAFKGIKKLPQSCYMVIPDHGDHKPQQYWHLPRPTLAKKRSIIALREELTYLLEESVKLRMISDVPLGAFLSGGVDSSAIVAMMAQQSSRRVKTFCIGFDEKEYDERKYARMVAERYDTDHHEMVVKPDAMEVLPSLIWHYNEPFADPSAIPTYYLSEIARKEVTVALNGDGGDESFLGYSRYKQVLQTEWISRLPNPVRRLGSWLSAAIPTGLERHRIPRVMKRWLAYTGEKRSRLYAPAIAYFFEGDKLNGYDDNLIPYLESSSLDLLEPYFQQSPSYVGGAAWADIHTYLPDDLLVKVDVASMAHGLEGRSPFLDHKLMEWAALIPPSQKISARETKIILKSAMEPFLPDEVLYRPKMGFGVPIDHWLRSELKDFAYDILLCEAARNRGLVKPSFVRAMLDEHCAGVRMHHTRLWALLMLELWFQMWIDPADPPLSPPEKSFFDRLASQAANERRERKPDGPGKILHQIEKESMIKLEGEKFHVCVPEYYCEPDTARAAAASSLILLEDGVPLEGPHSMHQDIQELGGGRHSHWGNEPGDEGVLFFSSSDGSDPRTNDKKYTLVLS